MDPRDTTWIKGPFRGTQLTTSPGPGLQKLCRLPEVHDNTKRFHPGEESDSSAVQGVGECGEKMAPDASLW